MAKTRAPATHCVHRWAHNEDPSKHGKTRNVRFDGMSLYHWSTVIAVKYPKQKVVVVAGDGIRVDAGILARLPEVLRQSQALFDRTGGVHAAGLFTAEGELLCLREDVGRHNAVDKIVGWAVREDRLPLSGTVLQVSGRASFELVQKARLAGIPVLAAVSAPSSLAVDLAAASGMTLVGFSRGSSLAIYTCPERVLVPATAEVATG